MYIFVAQLITCCFSICVSAITYAYLPYSVMIRNCHVAMVCVIVVYFLMCSVLYALCFTLHRSLNVS
jgi:hypothetical protein